MYSYLSDGTVKIKYPLFGVGAPNWGTHPTVPPPTGIAPPPTTGGNTPRPPTTTNPPPTTGGGSGQNGLSAYQVAVSNGFIGDTNAWLDSLKGENGKSAYMLAVDAGFTGTIEEWIASLKAEYTPGDYSQTYPTYQEMVDDAANVFKNTPLRVVADTVVENNGSYVYNGTEFTKYEIPSQPAVDVTNLQHAFETLTELNESTVENGLFGAVYNDVLEENNGYYKKTADVWSKVTYDPVSIAKTYIDSLEPVEGAPGADGASAYQIAVTLGFVGSEEEWLASLKPVVPPAFEVLTGEVIYAKTVDAPTVLFMAIWQEESKPVWYIGEGLIVDATGTLVDINVAPDPEP